jgi:methylated-DNA-[protein]-cysteine S-methyltransferase
VSTDRTGSATWHTVVATSLGDLTLVRDAAALRGLYFPHHWYLPDPTAFGARADQGFGAATVQLAEYLAGERYDFDLAIEPRGDGFQRAVWDLVRQVGYGETITYGQLAARVGGGATAQQVGAAVGRNPLSILIPCHRVVGRDGKLTGYAGGIGRKRRLLELEQDQLARATGTPFQASLTGTG